MPPGRKRLPRAKLAALFPLTDDEIRKLHQIADTIWNQIGYDVLQATVACDGGSINSVTLSRDEVIEVVMDADRLAEEVRQATDATPALRRLFPREWDQHASDYVRLLLKDGFTFGRYGL